MKSLSKTYAMHSNLRFHAINVTATDIITKTFSKCKHFFLFILFQPYFSFPNYHIMMLGSKGILPPADDSGSVGSIHGQASVLDAFCSQNFNICLHFVHSIYCKSIDVMVKYFY